MLFTALRYDTGEIMLSRAEIAEHVGDRASQRVVDHAVEEALAAAQRTI